MIKGAAMMATVNVTIIQQIMLQLHVSDQYYMYLRYNEFTMKTKNLKYMVIL